MNFVRQASFEKLRLLQNVQKVRKINEIDRLVYNSFSTRINGAFLSQLQNVYSMYECGHLCYLDSAGCMTCPKSIVSKYQAHQYFKKELNVFSPK